MQIIGRKVIVSRDEVASFNRGWPGSTLRATRAYWFDFDSGYTTDPDLVDTDVPEQDDGPAAHAMAMDCREFLRAQDEGDDWRPSWSPAAV